MPTASKDAFTVLVADDDPVFRNMVAACLGGLKGRVTEAGDGSEAWRLLLARSFDLAIVDLGMPNLDGHELIRCARSHQRTRHLPIVVVTANSDPEAVETALAAGATAFLTRPVDWLTFGGFVGALMRLAATERRARASARLSDVIATGNGLLLANLCDEVRRGSAAIRHALLAQTDADTDATYARSRNGIVENGLETIEHLLSAAAAAEQLSRVLADEIAVSDRKTDIDLIVAAAIASTAPQAKAAGVTIDADLPTPGASVSCHATSVEMVIEQLLRNAIAHSTPGSLVRLSRTIYEDGMLAIAVADTGTGMHPEFVARALAARSVLERGLAAPGTTGFGLPLAKAVANAHGGALEIRSMVGDGTTAMLVLPPDRVFERPPIAA